MFVYIGIYFFLAEFRTYSEQIDGITGFLQDSGTTGKPWF
jgi:hypothetical protein